MQPVYKDQSKYGAGRYIGSNADDQMEADSDTQLFGLQGDDTLTVPQWGQWGTAPVLVGGAGNDTYVISEDALILDAGGGEDTLYLPLIDSSSLKSSELTVVIVDNKHLGITDSYSTLAILNYREGESRIENVKFSDGVSIGLDQVVSSITSSGGGMISFTSEQAAVLMGLPASGAHVFQAAVDEITTANTAFENEVAASSQVPVEDVQPGIGGLEVQSIARLYQAAFHRTPDVAGLNYWVSERENGLSLEMISTAFLQSEEFKSYYGSAPTDSEYVNALYENTLGRAADAAGYDYWLNEIDNDVINREQMLVSFSDSAENIERTQAIVTSLHEVDGQWLF